MDVFREFDLLPGRAKGCVMAIGNFDGVHLGHQKLLDETKAMARACQAPSAVLTFTPHPRFLMQPGKAAFGLASLPAKLDRLRRQRISFCFIARFDRHLAETGPEEFVERWLVGRLGVRHVLVGEGYRFGRKRMGDAHLLHALGRRQGFGVSVVAPLRDEGGEVVSSSRIRDALASGMPHVATRLLGRPWEVVGPATRREANVIAVSLDGYQTPTAGTYAAEALAEADDLPFGAPVTARVVGGPAGGILLARDAVPSDTPFLRIRLLDLLAPRHA